MSSERKTKENLSATSESGRTSDAESRDGPTKKLLAEVQQEKELLTSLMNSISDEIWFVDTEGRFVLANESALKEFRLSESKINLDVKTFADSLEVFRADGTPRPAGEAPPLRALRGEVVQNEEEIVRAPSTGELRNRQVTAAPVRDSSGKIIGSISVVRDITERRKADDSLRRTRDYLESLMNYANAPIIVWDPSFKITRFNRAFERMTGYSADEILGRDLSILFPQITRDQSLLEIAKTLAGKHWESVEIPVQRKDGDIRIALWNSANVYAEDGKRLVATMAQGQDITRRVQAENSLREYSLSLAQSNRELQSFAYAASHDLREPLRTISGFLELLAIDYGDRLDSKAKDYITRSVDASNRLHLMIDDLLSFSRLETRKRPFIRVDLNEILKTALRDLDKTITEHGAKIEPGHLPEVMADDQQMAIVFRNLIDNAIKFHRDNHPEVRIKAQKRDDEWWIGVGDNGIGIDPSNQSKIFNMFSRLHSWKEYPGTGIGLAMCRKIVERHGGRIWVESEKGKGSTFYFSLPDFEAISNRMAFREGRSAVVRE